MAILLLAQRYSGGLGKEIAKVIRGEPWAWLELLALVAIAVAGTLAYRWWVSRA